MSKDTYLLVFFNAAADSNAQKDNRDRIKCYIFYAPPFPLHIVFNQFGKINFLSTLFPFPKGPSLRLEEQLQPTAVLSDLAYLAHRADGTLVLGVVL